MHINSLISSDKVQTCKLIKRAVSHSTDSIAVDGSEHLLLTILLNLTMSEKPPVELNNRDSAEAVLKDWDYMKQCAQLVRYYHTHNLKMPDARVSKQRLIAAKITPHAYLLTSANLALSYGYSYDAKHNRKAKLFLTLFQWQGETTNLATLLINDEPLWLSVWLDLGIEISRLKDIQNMIIVQLPENDIPDSISPYSVQIRMPYKNGYLSLTPVSSHSVLVKVDSMLRQKALPSTQIHHKYSANIGELLASNGGVQRVIRHPPLVRKKTATFNDSRILSANKYILLNDSILISFTFTQHLKDLTLFMSKYRGKSHLAHRQKINQQIRKTLILWLLPVMEWRHHVNSGHSLKEEIKNSLLNKLVCMDKNELPGLCGEIAKVFHGVLGSFDRTASFAYHSMLLQPIKKHLKSILSDFETHYASVSEDSGCFLHIKQLKISGCSVLSNPYTSGIPSLTALFGFVHKFSLNFSKLSGHKVQMDSVALFVHDHTYTNTLPLPEGICVNATKNEKVSENIKRPLAIPHIYCDMVVDIVVNLSVDNNCTSNIENAELYKAALPSHFSGGTIHPPFGHKDSWLELIKGNDLFDNLSRLPRSGSWLVPSDEPLKSFDETIKILKKNPTYRLVNTGFKLLEEPVNNRLNSTSPLHAYAEPALGLINCINPIEIRRLGLVNFIETAFWSLHSESSTIFIHRVE